MDILGTSLNKICNKNCHVWLAGDFNLSGFDWLENNINLIANVFTYMNSS